jgi:hypothetical protein
MGYDLAVILFINPLFGGIVRAQQGLQPVDGSMLGTSAGGGGSGGVSPMGGHIPRARQLQAAKSACILAVVQHQKRSSAMVSPTMAKSRSHL